MPKISRWLAQRISFSLNLSRDQCFQLCKFFYLRGQHHFFLSENSLLKWNIIELGKFNSIQNNSEPVKDSIFLGSSPRVRFFHCFFSPLCLPACIYNKFWTWLVHSATATLLTTAVLRYFSTILSFRETFNLQMIATPSPTILGGLISSSWAWEILMSYFSVSPTAPLGMNLTC